MVRLYQRFGVAIQVVLLVAFASSWLWADSWREDSWAAWSTLNEHHASNATKCEKDPASLACGLVKDNEADADSAAKFAESWDAYKSWIEFLAKTSISSAVFLWIVIGWTIWGNKFFRVQFHRRGT